MTGIDVSGNKLRFGFKIIIQRHLGNAGPGDHRVYAGSSDAMVVKQFSGCFKQFIPRTNPTHNRPHN